jgi:hypothetical protein
MASRCARRCLAAGILLAIACQGGDHAAGRAASDLGADRSAAATTPSASVLRDPVSLTAHVELDGARHAFSGPGECHHTTEASIYEVPAAMWSTRFSSETGDFRHLNLTLWQPKAGGDTQVSLALDVGAKSHRIATVKGADPEGRGSGRVERHGEGGSLYVEGEDDAGRNIRLTVECPRFTEPVAEGG